MNPSDIAPPPLTSSFMRREVSKVDAIIQYFRSPLNNRIMVALDVFQKQVCEAEMLTTLGTMLQPGGQRYYLTPQDLKANLDEYAELELLAKEGRAFLDKMGYVPLRNATPPPGSFPIGETVDVVPMVMQHPGEEPLTSVAVVPKEPKKKAKP